MILNITHSWGGIHTFPMGINPKVNAIVRLEFELANNDLAIQDGIHYTTIIKFYPLKKSIPDTQVNN